jgi:hypothetical protein
VRLNRKILYLYKPSGISNIMYTNYLYMSLAKDLLRPDIVGSCMVTYATFQGGRQSILVDKTFFIWSYSTYSKYTISATTYCSSLQIYSELSNRNYFCKLINLQLDIRFIFRIPLIQSPTSYIAACVEHSLMDVLQSNGDCKKKVVLRVGR